MSEENHLPRDPQQRRLFTRIMDLIKRLAVRTKLAVMRHLIKSVEDDLIKEEKDRDN